MSPRRVLFITLTAVCVLLAQSPGYHITRTFAVGGSRNMGVDPFMHRLFVASGKFGPRPRGRGRPPILPGSFALLVIER